MISDHLVESLTKVTTKSFSKKKDPDKISIQRIFVDNWDEFLHDSEVIRRGLRPVVIEEVGKMMNCGTIACGFEIYGCPSCNNNHIICYTCKSRFCNPCGVHQAKYRSVTISASTLDVKHRHVVFTIDERLRDYFLKDRNLLNILFDSAKETLTYTFNKMNGKDHTFKPGFILTLHTFGRALGFNPHIHCILTEGAMDEENNYKAIQYINYETLRKSFMKQVLDNLKNYYKDNPKYLAEIKLLVNQIYKDKKNGFYVNAPKMASRRGKDALISYIIRYTGRPVMASSRIVDYNYEKKSIHYYYEDHETKKRVDVHEHVFEFMKKLIMHIAPTQFKMIRYYGLYATCNHNHKNSVKRLLATSTYQPVVKQTYRMDLIIVFDTDPFLCDCGEYMKFIDYWVPPRKRKGDDFYDSS